MKRISHQHVEWLLHLNQQSSNGDSKTKRNRTDYSKT